MTSISVLGSTGSIGTQALDVVRALPNRLHVVALAAGGGNIELFARQVEEFQPQVAALFDARCADKLRELLPHTRTKIVAGMDGVCEAATLANAEIVLGAMSGAAGLEPTLRAIEAGKDLAIANKETLVAAGELVTRTARERGVKLLPVDSEHSALAQCLAGEDVSRVQTLTITASGGPFVDTPREELENVSPQRALKHPTWTMGRKITIDSATLMNKALEVIEAFWLFQVPMEQIEVVVHRQSIVHSFVTMRDHSVKAQLGVPDMKLPIQWALLRGERELGAAPFLNLATMGPLTFEPVDEARFPALPLARRAMKSGGVAPCVLNAANEEAVSAFLDSRLNFSSIYECVSFALTALCDASERTSPATRPGDATSTSARDGQMANALSEPLSQLSLSDIQRADAQARACARDFISQQP